MHPSNTPIRGRDDNGIDRFVIEDPAHVASNLRRILASLLHNCCRGGYHAVVDVNQILDTHIRKLCESCGERASATAYL